MSDTTAVDPQAAARYFQTIIAAMASLHEMPKRCPCVPETELSGQEIRHLVVHDGQHSFRILFKVMNTEVVVLRVKRPFEDFERGNIAD